MAKTGQKGQTQRRKPRKRTGKVRFVTCFRHYRNGKVYFAKDYGYVAWPLGGLKAG